MAKFHGEIGYVIKQETEPGVWADKVVEKPYTGSIIKNVHRNESSGDVNDNFTVNNIFSIVASEPFAYDNFQSMTYIRWLAKVWKIASAEIDRPRILLTIGGVYNGKQAKTS